MTENSAHRPLESQEITQDPHQKTVFRIKLRDGNHLYFQIVVSSKSCCRPHSSAAIGLKKLHVDLRQTGSVGTI